MFAALRIASLAFRSNHRWANRSRPSRMNPLTGPCLPAPICTYRLLCPEEFGCAAHPEPVGSTTRSKRGGGKETSLFVLPGNVRNRNRRGLICVQNVLVQVPSPTAVPLRQG